MSSKIQKLVYDPEVKVSYGLNVCPECKARFYGGGRALHNTDCSIKGYEGTEYHFGDEQVAAVISKAKSFGPDSEWYGISLNDLKEQFSHLLEAEQITA